MIGHVGIKLNLFLVALLVGIASLTGLCLASTFGEAGQAIDRYSELIYEPGNAATIYVYPDHTTYGNPSGKINSIYAFDNSNQEAVECGYMTNGKGYIDYESGTGAGLTVPFATYTSPGGTYSFWTLASPANKDNQWEDVAIRRNYDGLHPKRWSIWIEGHSYSSLDLNTSFSSASLDWGSERNRSATPLGGSFESCQYYTGTTWTPIWHGEADGSVQDNDPAQKFDASQLPLISKARFVAR